MPPSGCVSSIADAASSVVWGREAIASRARWRCPARSPRLLPNATYARSRAGWRSALDCKVTRDPLQIRRQRTKLPDRTLEVGLARCSFAGALGEGVGIHSASGRAGGNLLDLPGQTIHRITL